MFNDTSTVFNGIPNLYMVFSVIDKANGFWSVPRHPDSQPWLAFFFVGEQYQWTHLPQGHHNSPTLSSDIKMPSVCASVPS